MHIFKTEWFPFGGNPDLNKNKGIGYEYMLENAKKLKILDKFFANWGQIHENFLTICGQTLLREQKY